MEDYSSNNSSYSNNSYLSNIPLDLNSHLFYYERDHYLCAQCLKFPYIKFSKDRRHIRLTCSCFNNKTILIKDLFEKNILCIESNFFSATNLYLNINIENELKCKKHNKKFEGFSKICLDNYCQKCIFYQNNGIIINFDDIKIEDIKIEQLLNKLNNNKPFEKFNINNEYKIINKSSDICEKLSKEDEYFNELINIIINDYKNYPNFLHFFNIKNLLYFLILKINQ